MSGWREIEDAIALFTGGRARLVAHVEKGWSSPRFTGAKHELTFSCLGDAAVLAGEAMLAELPHRRFRMRDHEVAGAEIQFVHREIREGQLRLDARVEFLLLDDPRKDA